MPPAALAAPAYRELHSRLAPPGQLLLVPEPSPLPFQTCRNAMSINSSLAPSWPGLWAAMRCLLSRGQQRTQQRRAWCIPAVAAARRLLQLPGRLLRPAQRAPGHPCQHCDWSLPRRQ